MGGNLKGVASRFDDERRGMNNGKRLKRVLIFIGYYSPAFRAGGPIRTTERLISALGDEFDFWIVTRDRDIGDRKPFEDIQQNQWLKVGKANVYYAQSFRLPGLVPRLVRDLDPDVLYFNSFFDPLASIFPLIVLRWQNLRRNRSSRPAILLAPHGEFSNGALALKSWKKHLFLNLAGITGIHRDVTIHVTALHELDDTRRALPHNRTAYAQTLSAPPMLEEDALRGSNRDNKQVSVVFLSRLSPMKNLLFALEVMALCKSSVLFDIYGPCEDRDYWRSCEAAIGRLPSNIEVRVLGTVFPNATIEVIAKYDLFFLPTLGENYGHVIAEALAAGTSLLISDRTPWRNLAMQGLGWDLPLEEGPQAFAVCIEKVAQRTYDERREWKLYVLRNAQKLSSIGEAVDANRAMLQRLEGPKDP